MKIQVSTFERWLHQERNLPHIRFLACRTQQRYQWHSLRNYSDFIFGSTDSNLQGIPQLKPSILSRTLTELHDLNWYNLTCNPYQIRHRYNPYLSHRTLGYKSKHQITFSEIILRINCSICILAYVPFKWINDIPFQLCW